MLVLRDKSVDDVFASIASGDSAAATKTADCGSNPQAADLLSKLQGYKAELIDVNATRDSLTASAGAADAEKWAYLSGFAEFGSGIGDAGVGLLSLMPGTEHIKTLYDFSKSVVTALNSGASTSERVAGAVGALGAGLPTNFAGNQPFAFGTAAEGLKAIDSANSGKTVDAALSVVKTIVAASKDLGFGGGAAEALVSAVDGGRQIGQGIKIVNESKGIGVELWRSNLSALSIVDARRAVLQQKISTLESSLKALDPCVGVGLLPR